MVVAHWVVVKSLRSGVGGTIHRKVPWPGTCFEASWGSFCLLDIAGWSCSAGANHWRRCSQREMDARETACCGSLARGEPQNREEKNLLSLCSRSALPVPPLTRLSMPVGKGDIFEGLTSVFIEWAMKDLFGAERQWLTDTTQKCFKRSLCNGAHGCESLGYKGLWRTFSSCCVTSSQSQCYFLTNFYQSGGCLVESCGFPIRMSTFPYIYNYYFFAFWISVLFKDFFFLLPFYLLDCFFKWFIRAPLMYSVYKSYGSYVFHIFSYSLDSFRVFFYSFYGVLRKKCS